MIHFHKWKATYVDHYVDTSWGNSAESTIAVYVCQKCRKAKSKSFYGAGFVPLENLQ